MNRVLQYFKSLTAGIYDRDYEFLKKFLTKRELEYFNRLPVYEKRHSLDVCYTLMDKYKVKDEELLKAALFHDIGKIKVKITPDKKAIAVLIKKIPPLARYLEKRLYFLQVYYNHAEYSGEICKEIGLSDKVIYIVKHHHDKNVKDEDVIKLQRADKEN
ncbi:hypothetical protein TKV_c08710 [Thermoanaerobacter kivui]|uniref:HD domain-containing protein n=1 Tax=Thermoanaerobacter kivui TaxID=2325 RepID=A0A097AQH4_THEKI|nr:HDIG domain-containing metalloprotein [Thermoanaerobacter kivui]AIS52053.1 hypothetical protein TKV_c08710 [Thermoanaerobacter kivui]